MMREKKSLLARHMDTLSRDKMSTNTAVALKMRKKKKEN